MKLTVIFICVLLAISGSAQTTKIFTQPTAAKSMQVKWLTETINPSAEYLLYRKTGSSADWQKLTATPLKRMQQSDAQSDAVLIGYIKSIDKLASLSATEKSNTEFALLVRSTYDEKLARALGCFFEDKNVVSGSTYQYKLVELVKGEEKELAVSKSLGLTIVKNSAPLSLQLNMVSSEVRLKWALNTEVFATYNVYRRGSGETNAQKVSAIPVFVFKADAPYYTTDSLDKSGTFFYSVSGLDAFGNESQRSTEVKVEMKAADNGKGAAITSVRNENNTVVIEWTLPEGEEISGVNILRTEDYKAEPVTLNTTLLKTTVSTFIDAKAKLNATYYYTVEVLKSNGSRSQSSPKIFTVRDAIAPAVPTGVKLAPMVGAIQISWLPNTDKDLQGYAVYRATRDDDNAYVLLTPYAITKTNYIDSLNKSLPTTFYYKIAAVDSAYNTGDFSKAVSTKLKDVTAPYAPFIKKVSSTDHDVTLRWEKNPELDMKQYDIYRKSGTADWQKFTTVNSLAADSFVDKTAELGTTYKYYIKAVDNEGNVSEASNEVTIALAKASPKNELKLNALYSATEKNVTLSWNDQLSDLLTGYMIYRKTGSKETYMQVSKLLPSNGFVDRQLGIEKKYSYKVKAVFSNGQMMESAAVEVTLP